MEAYKTTCKITPALATRLLSARVLGRPIVSAVDGGFLHLTDNGDGTATTEFVPVGGASS